MRKFYDNTKDMPLKKIIYKIISQIKDCLEVIVY